MNRTTSAGRTTSAAALLLLTAGLTVLGAAPANAVGAAYWVDGGSATCSDTGAGTSATPFCTISAGAKKAVNAGDTVHVAPGTYREQVNVAGSGTASDPIRLVGDGPGVVVLGTRSLSSAALWTATAGTAWQTPFNPPSAPRQVFVDGARLTAATSAVGTTSGSYFYDTAAKVLYVDMGGTNPAEGHDIEAGAQSYGVLVSARHDVVVSGIETRRQNFAGVRLASSSSAVTIEDVTATGSAVNGILLDSGTSGSTVRRATVSGSLSTGIKLTGTTGSTIADSVSHDNGLHGIGLATSSGNVLSGNTTYANVSVSPSATAAGIDVNTTSPDNVVRDNVSYGNQDTGIQVYAGSARALVVRNVSYQNGDHGFDTLNATDVRYVNNTAYDNRRDGISVEGGSVRASLANNLLIDNGEATNEYDIYVDPGSASGFSADYDVAWNDSTTPAVKFNGTVYPTIAGFRGATGQETHGLAFDPDFVAPASGDFRLTPATAAVDSADAGAIGFTEPAGGSVDDPLVPDTGQGSPAFADRGALEEQPVDGATDYAPHAALVLDPSSASTPPSVPVTADGRGSSDADLSGIATYTFDFGDGTTVGPQAGATATHAFRSPGTYQVRLTVRDASGLEDTVTASEVVTARAVQTYHVEQTDPACTDTGQGSQTVPFCSISAAAKVLLAGDTALVGAGTYREQVRPLASGEAGAPITLHATTPSARIVGSDDVSDAAGWTATGTSAWQHAYTPAAAPTQVWWDGRRLAAASSATSTTNGSWFYDASAQRLYVDIGGANPADGHTVSAGSRNFGLLLRSVSDYDVSGFTIADTNLAGIYLDLTDHVSVTDVRVSRAGTYGMTVDGSTRAGLSNLTTSDNLSIGVRFFNSSDSSLRSSSSYANQFHGVSVQGSQRVTVSGVTAHDNLRPGTRVATGIDVSGSSADVVVEDSTSYANDDSGIEAYTGASGTVIRRNVVYDNGDHGIDNAGAPRSVVASNTVVGNATAGINFEGGSSGGTTRDNIGVDNAVGSTRTIGELRVDESSAPGASLNRDLFYQSGGGPLFEWASQPYSTIADYRAASGQEPDGLSADPRFRDLAGRDLHLLAGSPAIDAAYTGFPAWTGDDLEGTHPADDPLVPDTGTGPDPFADLGALEFHGTVAVGTLTPTSGSVPLDVTVDGSGSWSGSGPISSYTWDCGNGSTSSGATSTCHYTTVGSFTVQLTVTDPNGGHDTWAGTVTTQPDQAPVANLTASPMTGNVPQPVVLDASGSTDTDSTPIATYAFDCGNGQKIAAQTGATATCTYTTTGHFAAKVTVTDTAGLSTTSTAVTVTVLANAPPVAALRASPTSTYAPDQVTLDASGSTDTDNTPIATYAFDCGNGQKIAAQTGATATCSYTTAGNFAAKVTVTDTAGLSANASVNVKILADAAPTARLTASPSKFKAGGTTVLDASASTDVDRTPVASYRFDCGNGTTTGQQTSPTTSCTYPTAGNFTARVWVTDTLGQVGSTTTKVSVTK